MVLEITETMLMSDPAAVRKRLRLVDRELAELGLERHRQELRGSGSGTRHRGLHAAGESSELPMPPGTRLPIPALPLNPSSTSSTSGDPFREGDEPLPRRGCPIGHMSLTLEAQTMEDEVPP